jgi:hypothetical protein
VGSFQTAFETLDLTSLTTAANLVAALQRTTKTTLVPTVVNWADAVAAKTPALLISSTPASTAALNPPITAEPIRVVNKDGMEVIRIGAEAQFAGLEGFEQNGRDVLVVTGDPAAVNALSATLLTDDLGWFGLQGDTWLKVGDSAPVSMTLLGDKLSAQPLTTVEQPWYIQALPILLFIIALCVVLILMAIAYPRVVRKTPTGAKS